MPITTQRQYRFQPPSLYQEDLSDDFREGLNTRDPVTQAGIRRGDNARFGRTGGFQTRPGSANLATLPGSGAVLGVSSYTKRDLTSYLIAVRAGQAYTVSGGTGTAISGLLFAATTAKVEACTFPLNGAGGTDCHYFVNGQDLPKKWDGTTVTTAYASYPIASYVAAIDNRPWLYRIKNITNRAMYGPLGADSFGGSFPATNTVDFPEEIVGGIEYSAGIHLVFGVSKIFRISDFDYSGVAVGPETIGPIPGSYGTLSMRTVKKIGPWVYFQSPDGHVRRTNAMYVDQLPVSDIVSPTVASFSPSQLRNAAAGAFGDYYHLAVTSSGAGQNDLTLVFDTTRAGRGGFALDTGKYSACFVSHPDANGFPQLVYGDSRTSSGAVAKSETGTNDSGTAIAMNVQTGVKLLGSGRYKKWIDEALVTATASGSYPLTFGFSSPSNLSSVTTRPVDLSTGASTWGTGKWGDGRVWGGVETVEASVPVHTRDYGAALSFQTSGLDRPVSVQSVALTYEASRESR